MADTVANFCSEAGVSFVAVAVWCFFGALIIVTFRIAEPVSQICGVASRGAPTVFIVEVAQGRDFAGGLACSISLLVDMAVSITVAIFIIVIARIYFA